MQHLVRRLPAPPTVVSYAVRLARSTRPDAPEATPQVKKYVSWGAGPRASQYLILGAKGRAAMLGRPCADFEGVRSVLTQVLGHRVLPSFKARTQGITTAEILRRISAAVSEKA
jgi:MoxR-like ATPase